MALVLAATFSTAMVAEGSMTWKIVEVNGKGTMEDFGIGDGKVIAATFVSGDGSTTLAPYVANADGSYTGIWAGDDDPEVSTETLKPD